MTKEINFRKKPFSKILTVLFNPLINAKAKAANWFSC